MVTGGDDAMSRYIFDNDPDPVELFDELFRGGARDYKNLPLGNVEEHHRERMVLSYLVLCLFGLVRDLGRFNPPVRVLPIGAEFQDKQTTSEFPAAHLLPCDLNIIQPGSPDGGIYDLLRNPFSRIWVQREVFGRTDRVHHFTNVADRDCERSRIGMRNVLARACQEVANSTRPPLNVFHAELVTGYRDAAEQALERRESKLSALERLERTRGHPVDAFGSPLVPRSTDIRLTSPDAEARMAAKLSVIQVLATYAAAPPPARQELADAAGKVEALRFNEGPYRD